jgi:hypothetical protein
MKLSEPRNTPSKTNRASPLLLIRAPPSEFGFPSTVGWHAEGTVGMPWPRLLGAAVMIIFYEWMNRKHLAPVAATATTTAATAIMTAASATAVRASARRFVWSVIAAAVRRIVGASR